MPRQYSEHGIEELEQLVRTHMHSRAVLGDIREELTYRETNRAKALLRDVMGLLTGHIEMPKRPRRADSPEDQLALLGAANSSPHGRTCECCRAGIPFSRPKQCPKCLHVFQGNGWDGIDAHWRSKHENDLTYEDFWAGLCPAHRA
jgi:hypothetical protein